MQGGETQPRGAEALNAVTGRQPQAERQPEEQEQASDAAESANLEDWMAGAAEPNDTNIPVPKEGCQWTIATQHARAILKGRKLYEVVPQGRAGTKRVTEGCWIGLHWMATAYCEQR